MKIKLVFLFVLAMFVSLSVHAQTFSVDEDTPFTFCGTDLSGGPSVDTMYLCGTVQHGTINASNNCATYTPTTNFFGYDSVCVTYEIAGILQTTTVHFTIYPMFDRITNTTSEDINVNTCEAVISGGQNVSFAACSAPVFGTSIFNAFCAIYDPAPNFIGLDSFCVVTCYDTLCDTSLLVITVNPVTESITQTVPGNQTLSICPNVLMTAVDTISAVTVTCGPNNNNGTYYVDGNNCVQYTPNANFVGTGQTGTDVICISMCNSQGICDITNVTINITGFAVTQNANATQLAQSLAGNGVTISNALLNCPTQASGVFQNAPNGLGISDGVILSTGKAIDAKNNSALVNASTSNNSGGDPNLNALLVSLGETYPTYDACVLEFDIQVLGDSLSFNYAMGSEEYPEFVCGSVNDAFGFFISGPNPYGPNYASKNVALVPNSTTPVSINTINGGSGTGGAATCILSNSAYYHSTLAGMVYDGFTVALEAKAATVPCQTYHFKLAIADGGDHIYDSGVFLKKGSFSSIPVTLASSTILGNGFSNAVENCVSGLFSFELEEPLTANYVVDIAMGGTATNGVDYAYVADSIIILAGDSVFQLQIDPTNDGLAEPTESVKVYLINNCTGLPFDSASLNIIDLIPFNLSISEDTVCAGDTVELQATIAGDNNNLAVYHWYPNNGTILDTSASTTQITPTQTQDYYVDYTLGNCTKTDTFTLYVPQMNVNYTQIPISCPGANDGSITAFPIGEIIGNVSYTWLPTNTTDSFVNNLGPDTIYSNVFDESGLWCHSITDTFIIAEPTLLSFNSEVHNISCIGLNDGYVRLFNLSASTSYDVDITYNGSAQSTLNLTSSASGEILIQNLTPGTYDTLIITKVSSGCSNGFSFVITEPVLLTTQIFVPGNVLCAGGTIDSLTAQSTGGTMPYTYLWNTSEITKTIQNITIGTYWVEITDTNNCTAYDTVIIAQPTPMFVSTLSDSVLCFGQNSGSAFIDSLSGGTPGYTFEWRNTALNIISNNDTASSLLAGTYYLTVYDVNNCTISDTVQVFEPTLLTVALVADTLSCFGDADACITATPSGGAAPYSIAWNNGATSFTICNLSAGWYWATTTDARGCISVDSIQVIQPTALALDSSFVNVTCKGLNNGSATVLVSGGTANYSYAWNDANNQSLATAANLVAGTYQVVVTDANLCMDSLSVSITEPADSLLLSLVSVTDVLCNGGATGNIQVSTSGGTPNYSYSWSNGGGANEDLLNATAGTYTLTVTDANNCTNQLTATINQPTAVGITFTQVNIDCYSASTGSIDATVSGGVGAYSFAWTGPNGFTASTEDISTLAAGTYVLTATDSNNCPATQTVILTQPQTVSIAFNVTDVSCFGGSDGSITASVASGGTAPFNFSWNDPAMQNNATANNLSEGTYTVTVTDNNGCQYTDSTTVNQPNTPLTLAIDSTDITCAGYNDGTATVFPTGGTPGYSFLWSDALAQTNATATGLAPGVVSVTVTDANGCAESISTLISEPTPLNPSALADSAGCWGENTGVIYVQSGGGTGVGYVYSIDGGETFSDDSIFTGLAAGIYDEIVIMDLGSEITCISQPISVTVYAPPYFFVSINPEDTTLQLEESVTLALVVQAPYDSSDVVQITWYPTTGLNCSDCVNPTVLTYEHYTEYTATINYQGASGYLCNQTATAIINVENNLQLFIPNAFTPGGFDTYNDNFEVFGEGIEYMTMQIYNRWGEKIFESSNQRVTWDGTYQGVLQNPGVYTYYVSVEYLDGKTIEKKGSVTLLR